MRGDDHALVEEACVIFDGGGGPADGRLTGCTIFGSILTCLLETVKLVLVVNPEAKVCRHAQLYNGEDASKRGIRKPTTWKFIHEFTST